MFKTIVWATDGSDGANQALAFAKELALEPGASLHVLHADERIAGSRAEGLPVLADEGELRLELRAQVDALREAGIDTTFDLVTGTNRPGHLIAEKAQELGADVIVVGTRGHRPLAGVLLGSVTQHLLHDAPCPVLAVPTAHLTESTEAAPEKASVS